MATEYSGDFAGDVSGIVTDELVLNDFVGVYFGTDQPVTATYTGQYLNAMHPIAGFILGAQAPWVLCPAHGEMMTDPGTAYTTFYDDFVTLSYATKADRGTGSTWRVIRTSEGAGADYSVGLMSNTVGESDGVGGVLSVMTSNSIDDSGDFVNFHLPGRPYYLSDGCSGDIWFEVRVALSDASECNGIIGLVAADSNLVNDAKSGFYFHFTTGSLEFVTEQGGTKDSTGYRSCDATLGSLGTTLSDGEFVRLAFFVDTSIHTVFPYINGLPASAYAMTDSTNAWPLVPLAPAFEVATAVDGEHAHMMVDWIKCVQIPHYRQRYSA